MRSSSLPERPTNGRPSRSSSRPGASPTNITRACGLPSANTSWVAVVRKRAAFEAIEDVARSSSRLAALLAASRAAMTAASGDGGGAAPAAAGRLRTAGTRRDAAPAAGVEPRPGNLRRRGRRGVGRRIVARTGRPASRRPARRRPPPGRRRAARGQPGRGRCSSLVRNAVADACNHACGARELKCPGGCRSAVAPAADVSRRLQLLSVVPRLAYRLLKKAVSSNQNNEADRAASISGEFESSRDAWQRPDRVAYRRSDER